MTVTALAMLMAPACSRDKPVQNDRGEVLRAASLSVFDLAIGNCAKPPDKADLELSKISVMPCDEPHTMEVYALPKYTAKGDFPGEQVLKNFADAKCADAFKGYVGIPYADSDKYFTYLTPSGRSWSGQSDRRVTCLVTTAGAKLSKSVKGSKQ